MRSSWRRWVGALLAVGLALGTVGAACDRAARKHPVSLDNDIFDFHQLLKGKKFMEASRFVKEERRSAFIASWQRIEGLADFQDLEVTRVTRTEDADYAHVEATLVYSPRNSLTVLEHRLFELWKGAGISWVIDNEVAAPPLVDPNAPAAAPGAPPPAAGTPPTAPPAPAEGFGGQ